MKGKIQEAGVRIQNKESLPADYGLLYSLISEAQLRQS